MAFTTPELILMLNSENSEERGIAARRVWTDWEILEDKNLILNEESHLIKLLKEETEERNIWHLMFVLGLLNSKKAIPLILDNLVNSKIENIRGFAADAFSRYSKSVVDDKTYEILWDLAENDPSLVVRVNCIRACSNIYSKSKNEAVTKRLFNLLTTQSHSAIKTTILQQIGVIGSMIVVPDLIHIMITRRLEVDKKMAGLALDEIAKINGYANRQDLIKQFKG